MRFFMKLFLTAMVLTLASISYGDEIENPVPKYDLECKVNFFSGNTGVLKGSYYFSEQSGEFQIEGDNLELKGKVIYKSPILQAGALLYGHLDKYSNDVSSLELNSPKDKDGQREVSI